MKYLTDVILVLIEMAANQPNNTWFRGITRLEKMIFLLMQEHGMNTWLKNDVPQFIPYKLGPYSREVYAAIDFLSSYGLIEDSLSTGRSSLDSMESILTIDPGLMPYEERRFRLTEDGQAVAKALRSQSSEETLAALTECYQQFGQMPLPSLLRHVYQAYPDYTGRSIIKDDIIPS